MIRKKWEPVLRQRSCSNKKIEPRSDAIGAEKALVWSRDITGNWIPLFLIALQLPEDPAAGCKGLPSGLSPIKSEAPGSAAPLDHLDTRHASQAR
jgi:hypothetical protein